MKILLGGGRGMFVGGQSAFWKLQQRLEAKGHEVRPRECVQTGTPQYRTSVDDVMWAEAGIVYSYGGATLWDRWHAMDKDFKNLPLMQKLVLVTTVPGSEVGQYGFFSLIWHAPQNVQEAWCFQVSDVPESYTLKNPGAANIRIGDPRPANMKYINVDCNSLFPAFSLFSTKHTGIKEHPAVLDAIMAIF